MRLSTKLRTEGIQKSGKRVPETKRVAGPGKVFNNNVEDGGGGLLALPPNLPLILDQTKGVSGKQKYCL